MADTENLSPALVNVLKELRRVVDVEIKSEVAHRMADEGMAAAEIARFLHVSRNTIYRYLGPGWKSRTRAQAEAWESRGEGEGLDQDGDFEAHQPAAVVADAAGHDLTDQPARLDRGP